MARTLAKIPSDLHRRIAYKNSAEKCVMYWVAMESSFSGVVEFSTLRVAQNFGIRKNKVRDAVASLAERNILTLEDNYNLSNGGVVWWSEKTCWALYFGNHSSAQLESVMRSLLPYSHLFVTFTFSQVLEQQWGVLLLYNDNKQDTNYKNKNNRQKKSPSDLSALGGRKSSDETEEEAFKRKRAKILEDECIRNGGSGRAPE